MSFWNTKRVTVTGGSGFLGRQVVAELRQRGCKEVFVPEHSEYDLVDMGDVERVYTDSSPDIVIHLAANVGGIGANQRNPGTYFYANAMMGLQMMEVGRRREIEKFVAIGTICAYPKYATIPFREDDIWSGYPEETNAPYGLAKKMMLVQAQAYRQQYGFNAIYLLPVNLYGPGDNFDPDSSHVIPAIIRKCVHAALDGTPEITLWGTGNPTREFLHVQDAATGIVLATERYNDSDPVNLGAGAEISIRDLATLIRELTGFQGEIVWDHSRPDGQPRRSLDTSRAIERFGFKAEVPLTRGLEETIDWYRTELQATPAAEDR
jgi:GDP-L-fucose synthase